MLQLIMIIILAVLRITSAQDDIAPLKRDQTCKLGKDPRQLNSFLWKLNRDPPSYFFGTIHVPYMRVWDFIPDSTKSAFVQADHVFFELDLTDSFTMTSLANCQLLPQGKNLSAVLPEELYQRLKHHLDYIRSMLPSWMTPGQKGRWYVPDNLFRAITGNWERKRPVWVMLMVNSLTESDIKSRGIPVLDLYLAQEAERMRKVTGAVERVEEQCMPLNKLDFSQVLFALNQTLWQHEAYRQQKGSLPYTTEDLIYHYNCGDLNDIIFNQDTAQLPNLVNASLPPKALHTARLIDEYFRKELIFKRNQRMSGRIRRLLTAHPTRSFFFALGAGHFLGNNTILDQLRQSGFDISHMAPNTTLPHMKKYLKRLRKHRWSKHGQIPSVSADYPMPPLLVQGHIEYDPFTHFRRRRPKKPRPKRPNFNDLWVKIKSSPLPISPPAVLHSLPLTTPEAQYIRDGNKSASHRACLDVRWHVLELILVILIWRLCSLLRL